MSPSTSTPAPALVLVHSPLVGPLTWTRVAEELRSRGRTVVLPRLDNDAGGAVPLQRHHAERIRRAVEAEVATATPVVLVAHSGGGPVLPVAGATLVHEVSGYVLVDSDLPRDGASRLDGAPPDIAERIRRLAQGGEVPPWAEWWSDEVLAALLPDEEAREAFAGELRPLPLRLFEERLRVPPEWPDAPCGYLRLSGAYDEPAAAAARQGWSVVGIDAGHLHMLADPPAVADALEGVLVRLDLAEPTTPGSSGRVSGPAGASGATGPSGASTAGPSGASGSLSGSPAGSVPLDPVLARRQRIARWVDRGRRVGFLALAVAVLLFAVALYWDLPAVLVTLIVAAIALAAVTLLPSLIAGYGIAAAEREDRERGRGGLGRN